MRVYSQLWVARRVYSRLGYANYFLWRGALFAPEFCVHRSYSVRLTYGLTHMRLLHTIVVRCLLARLLFAHLSTCRLPLSSFAHLCVRIAWTGT